MKKYFVALIVLLIVFITYSSFAQRVIPIPSSSAVVRPPVTKPSPTPVTSPSKNPTTSPTSNPNMISATVKGSIYIKKGDEKAQFKITVYKLISNRWVNVDNFSTMVAPNGEYLTVIRGAGTYKFVPSVKFNPQVRYTFFPTSQAIYIKPGVKNAIYIRNFNYKKDIRR